MDIKKILEIPEEALSEEDEAVQKAISRANVSQGAFSMVSLLVSWVWVIFAGFGQKIYESTHVLNEKKSKFNGKN